MTVPLRYAISPVAAFLLIVGCEQPLASQSPTPAPGREGAAKSGVEAVHGAKNGPKDNDSTERHATNARVSIGPCDVSWLPPGLVEKTDAAETEELVERVRAWLSHTGFAPALEVARGVCYAKSEDDGPAGPEYPSFVNRDAALACGRNALWLREHLRTLVLSHVKIHLDGVKCARNVCCYASAGEYTSSGTIVFSHVQNEWALRAVIIVADNASNSDGWIWDERRWIVEQLISQLKGKCAGEPASLVWTE